MKKNEFFGWILKENPRFWEDQGFERNLTPCYYGCEMAKVNRYPAYRKVRYINQDSEEQAAVEVFPCDYGAVKHDHLVFLFVWNNAGGCKYPMLAAKQVSTVSQYNEFIKEYGLDKLEDDETFLLDF